jgi:ribonuclease-3
MVAQSCITQDMDDDLKQALGHEFGSKALLEQALTHRSVALNGRASYERLEFLGDRVLGFMVADLLLEAYPNEAEGPLAKRHADLVRRETLADVAREGGIGRHIRMSRGEVDSGGQENDAILSDVCEALIAAIYRDGGIEKAQQFITRYWMDRLQAPLQPPEDAKTILQELAQGRGLPLPEYRTVGREGPDHAPVFTVTVCVEGWEVAEGSGTSKRVAERVAAQALLLRVGVNV